MITIIDTGIGNFKSIQNMIKRLGYNSILSNDRNEIKSCSILILPGVGSFDKGMKVLEKYDLIEVIKEKADSGDSKILGVCLGMQLLANSSEEGDVPGLGIIDGEVKKFYFSEENKKLKTPHMGWNYALPITKSPLLENLDKIPRFYFTHSYHFVCKYKSNELAYTPYGNNFISAINKNNIYGVQFHPEKSHRFGMQLFRNFLEC